MEVSQCANAQDGGQNILTCRGDQSERPRQRNLKATINLQIRTSWNREPTRIEY